MHRATTPIEISHYNVQNVFDIFAAPQDRDLGGVAADIDRIVARERANLPRGTQLVGTIPVVEVLQAARREVLSLRDRRGLPPALQENAGYARFAERRSQREPDRPAPHDHDSSLNPARFSHCRGSNL